MSRIPFDYQAFLKTCSQRAGVYQMFNDRGEMLYIGKAKNLKKRLSSYFRRSAPHAKVVALVSQIAKIEILITETENQALLLENNLIKKYRPKFNVLFRDDKSYPFIFVSADEYPRVDFHRGAKAKTGNYFGPYPSSGAVRQTINFLQKVFKIRTCQNSFFKNRSRPCIQYQIKRCTAPCVKYIEKENYNQSIALVKLFLQGKDKQIMELLGGKMQQAAKDLAYEKAAQFRDQIANLRLVQSQQVITQAKGNMDVMAIATRAGVCAVEVLFIRNGRMLGNHTYFPNVPVEAEKNEILADFIPQFYLHPAHKHDLPEKLIVSHMVKEPDWIRSSLQEALAQSLQITIANSLKDKQLVKMALVNASTKLTSHLQQKLTFKEKFNVLQSDLGLKFVPNRIECFDISHTQGDYTYASCVVFDNTGMLKADYRRFKIKDITKGDDYAALYQALEKRYRKVKDKPEPAYQVVVPDVIMIDGGKGQLNAGIKALSKLALNIRCVLAIAKGTNRKSGLETIFHYCAGTIQALNLAPASFFLLQQVRDEAHRFAITGHKNARSRNQVKSELDSIVGVGNKRKSQLLKHFGGLNGLKNATMEEINQVQGIGRSTAGEIYATLHGNE